MDATELDRFLRKVVKGPEPDDCWIWVGAIADDGYGRFALTRPDRPRRQQMVRPQRLLFEHVTGRHLHADETLLHACDVPICVHATGGADSHLYVGDTTMNMRDREHKQRAGRGRAGMRGISRKLLAERSRQLRTLILEHDWDDDAIAAILAGNTPDDPRLF